LGKSWGRPSKYGTILLSVLRITFVVVAQSALPRHRSINALELHLGSTEKCVCNHKNPRPESQRRKKQRNRIMDDM